MHTFYCGASSYSYYVAGHYTEAIKQLEQGIEAACKQSQSLPSFISAAYEQWFNKVRVYFKMEDYRGGIEETERLMAFGLGLGEPTSAQVLLGADAPNVMSSMLVRVQSELMHYLELEPAGVLTRWNVNLMESVADGLEARTTVSESFSGLVRMLAVYYRGDDVHFLEDLAEKYDCFLQAPAGLQKLALRAAGQISRRWSLPLQWKESFQQAPR